MWWQDWLAAYFKRVLSADFYCCVYANNKPIQSPCQQGVIASETMRATKL